MAIIGAFLFSSRIVNHAELRGRSLLTNGLEEVRKYNPATGNWLPACLRPIRQAPVFAAGGAGNLNGDYTYRIVPYNANEDEEGEAFPVDGAPNPAYEFNAVNQSVNINLAGLRIDSPETTAIRIYRTSALTVWPVLALVGEVALPAGVFNDNVADDDLDFANEGLDTLATVPIPKPFICQHRERLFLWGDVPYAVGQAGVTNGAAVVTPEAGAVFGFWLEGKEFHAEGDGIAYEIDEYDPATGNITLTENYQGATRDTDYRICGDPDALIWCEPDAEWQWPAANRRPIGGKEGTKPSGLFSSQSVLLCPKDRRIYHLLYTSRPNYPPAGDSRSSIATHQFGGLAHRSWRSIRGMTIGASKEGIIQVAGDGAQLLSEDAREWFQAEIAINGDGTQQRAFAVEWKDRAQYILFFPSQDAAMGCDRALVWHYLTGKLSYYKFLTEFMCGEVMKAPNGTDVIVLGDSWGYCWQFPYGHTDGAPEGTTVSGTVTNYETGVGSPGICVITDENATFPTTGLGLAGVPVYIPDLDEWVIIAANTETELFLEECFSRSPLGMTYHLGPIEFIYKTGWLDFGTIASGKRADSAFLVHESDTGSEVNLRPYKDFESVPTELVDERTAENHGLLDLGDVTCEQKIPFGGIEFKHLSLEFRSFLPKNPISIWDLSVKVMAKDPS